MSGVDVLAVMDRAIKEELMCDELDLADELIEARAAVAELIEADLEVGEAEAECAKYPGEGSSHWLANAKARRAAALSRVRGDQ